jgi:hypothetical protein
MHRQSDAGQNLLIEVTGNRFDLDRSPRKIDPHDFAHAGVAHVAPIKRPWDTGLVAA